MIKCKLDYSKVPSSIYIVYKLQGTASVVLAGLIVAQKLLGGILAEHTFLILGAGEVTFFVLLCLEISHAFHPL